MIVRLVSAAELPRAVAEYFVAQARAAISNRGRFTVALSGGESPRGAYALLGSELRHLVAWGAVQVFWSDERCVPPDDPRSNYRMAADEMLRHVPIPPANVHRVRGEDDPPAAAAAYTARLEEVLQGDPFDLVLLGLGKDGHTASLFPGQAAPKERLRPVVAEQIPAAAGWRITLTPVAINAARAICFIVSGRDKAGTLGKVLEGPFDPEFLPAQRIKPDDGQLTWFIDWEAASTLRLTGSGRSGRTDS